MKKIYKIMPKNFHDNVMNVVVGDTFWQRFKGLIGTSFLPETEGLLLCKCNSIHMFGMLYALDIIYLDKDGVILKVVENIKPFQVSCCWKAQDTLEVKRGTIKQMGWKIGEKLKWQK
jgi:hypothetical protein